MNDQKDPEEKFSKPINETVKRNQHLKWPLIIFFLLLIVLIILMDIFGSGK